MAAAGDNLKALRLIARAHIAAARAGDMQAIKELADRLDGKPAQEQHVNVAGEVAYVARIPDPIATTAEWADRYGAKDSTQH